jgi:hypothetical protein
MQIDRLAVTLRTRDNYEAIDLGVALLRANLGSFYRVYGLTWGVLVLCAMLLWVLTPLGLLWSTLLLWWLKPVLDRAALAHLSKALFGEKLDVRSFYRTFPALLRDSGLVAGLLWRRLSLRRSVFLPAWQLEKIGQLSSKERQARLQVLGGRRGDAGRMLTILSVHLEAFMLIGWLMGAFMLIPSAVDTSEWIFDVDHNWSDVSRFGYFASYALAILLVEPIYVAGGFMLYIHRRIELEGWDIEVAFRRMAERLARVDAQAGQASPRV